MTRALVVAALLLVIVALRRRGWELHRDCVPHGHAERNMRRWERDQARSLARAACPDLSELSYGDMPSWPSVRVG